MLFFQERRGLKFLNVIRSESPTVNYENVDGFIGFIVASRCATFIDLREKITLEEACDLYEIEAVNRTNEYLAAEYARKGKK